MPEKIDYEKLYQSMEKRYVALGKTNARLAKELDVVKGLYSIMVQEKAQWELQKGVQNNIIHKQLGSSDRTVGRLQDEIEELRTERKALRLEIKRLKNGNND